MDKRKYTIIIEKSDNGYSSYAPDLPGCVAAGKTCEETRQLMKEAIEFHIEGLIEDGLPIPEPVTSFVEIEVQQAV